MKCECPENVIRGTTMECQFCWDARRKMQVQKKAQHCEIHNCKQNIAYTGKITPNCEILLCVCENHKHMLGMKI